MPSWYSLVVAGAEYLNPYIESSNQIASELINEADKFVRGAINKLWIKIRGVFQ